uniref:Uncharacterized protein n=1 Tax=Romanomermis culicivorax TaxID=13658 RepID=A0A915JCZ3_ROMCU
MTAHGTNRGGGGAEYSHGRSPAAADRVTLATVLETMHTISVNSKTGLVRLHRIIKRLRSRKPGWNQWSINADLSKDQSIIRFAFVKIVKKNDDIREMQRNNTLD